MLTRRPALLLLLLSTTIACNRSDNNNDDMAGKGGKATLKVMPAHHEKQIDSCTVYIKYNTRDAPATYDDSVKTQIAGGVPTATFTELKKGDYYLYGRGWDKDIQQVVTGGIPVTITQEAVVPVNLPVSEQH